LQKTIWTIGVPMDLGQSRRGVDMGPSAVRYGGLAQRLRSLGYPVHDHGDVPVAERDTLPEEGGMAYLPAAVDACTAAYRAGLECLEQGGLPIFLGGDHSIALGTVAAAATSEASLGVIWVDAHGDFNTPETSPTGNIHGMPLAALTGRGAPELVNLGHEGVKVEAHNVVLIGIRDLDDQERVALRESGATVFTMRDIDERGMGQVTHEALRRLGAVERIHVSLDMDALDPREAPGVGTPVPGGLTYREAHALMEILADSGKIGSMDVVEINPILDTHNRTAQVAIELVLSALGKKIF
jgi:arginase